MYMAEVSQASIPLQILFSSSSAAQYKHMCSDKKSTFQPLLSWMLLITLDICLINKRAVQIQNVPALLNVIVRIKEIYFRNFTAALKKIIQH